MINPQESQDENGEWFELTNTGLSDVDLYGFTLKDNDYDQFIINSHIIISPDSFKVFGANVDTAINGGVEIDYEYSDIQFANTGDELLLIAPNGTTIDSVEWRVSNDPFNYRGYSISLLHTSFDNSTSLSWNKSILDYNGEDYGTPGSPNIDQGIVEGNIFYVDNAGSDIVGDGSFSNPYSTIQHAIDVVDTGDIVIVLPGTYYENISYGGKDIFIGSQAMLNGDWDIIEQTVIDGNANGSVVTINSGDSCISYLFAITVTNGSGTYADPDGDGIYHNVGGAIYINETGAVPMLKNLIIKENIAELGGGLFLNNSNANILKSNIHNNSSTYGAGFYLRSSLIRLSFCVIDNNSASLLGGGGYLFSNSSLNSKHCTFTQNSEYALYFDDSGCSLLNTILWDNWPIEMAGVNGYWTYKSYCDIKGEMPGNHNINENPIFCDAQYRDYNLASNSPCIGAASNSTRDIGAVQDTCSAMEIYDGPCWYVSTGGSSVSGDGSIENPLSIIQDAIFRTNPQDTVIVLPGVYTENINFFGQDLVVGSQFLTTEDTAYISQTIIDGGGEGIVVYIGTGEHCTLSGFTITNGSRCGIYCVESWPILEYLRVTGNIAGDSTGGAGIYSESADPIIRYTLIDNNHATTNGGGFKSVLSNPILYNVTMTENSSDYGGKEIFVEQSEFIMVNSIVWNINPIRIVYSIGHFAFSNINGGRDNIQTDIFVLINWYDGNMNINPEFTIPSQNDYSLLENSPCIDMGTNSFEISYNPVFNIPEDSYNGLAPDIGAFESPFTVSTKEELILPNKFAIHQNYPNPFNPTTTIRYDLPEATNVQVVIYDLLGRQVIKLVNELQDAGYRSIKWNGQNSSGHTISTGIYFYQIKAGKNSSIKKMVLLK